jgi:hypothetical protein
MKGHSGKRLRWSVIVLGLAVALLVAAAAPAGVTFTRVTTIGVGSYPNFGMTRTGDGTLHLSYQTPKSATNMVPDGLGERTIGKDGTLGGKVQALSGWNVTHPGLVAMPNGSLLSAFGAISPKTLAGGVWASSSSNGGATWTAPADVGSHSSLEALSYGADVTGQLAGSTPVLTLTVAGHVVVQRGLGKGSPTQEVTNKSDGSAGNVDSAADPGSNQVVASWASLAGKGGDYMQTVAPTLGKAQLVPGKYKNEVVISGRDNGSGVFGAYTTDDTHVRLLRYGGSSVKVGAKSGVIAAVLGTATGIDGRIWVMWGSDNGGIAVTRSNMAVTRFEPIQHFDPKAFSLYRLAGDGRLGPLDLFVDEIPTVKGKLAPPGSFHARVLPEPSVAVSVKKIVKKNNKGKVVKIVHKLKTKVTDAGDPLKGATVAAAGKSATTNAKGRAVLKLHGSHPGKVTVKVTHPGYRTVKKRVKL